MLCLYQQVANIWFLQEIQEPVDPGVSGTEMDIGQKNTSKVHGGLFEVAKTLMLLASIKRMWIARSAVINSAEFVLLQMCRLPSPKLI